MAQMTLPRSEAAIRLACIVGACACFVVGLRFVYEKFAYDISLDLVELAFLTVPFVPIVAVAPRYRNGKVVYAFIGLAELFIVVMDRITVVR
jgi:hypothetical protein